MKTCIFVAGEKNVGKSSIVRALTGCGRDGYWKVKNHSGKRIWALVLLSSIGEKYKFNPSNFPKELEKHVKRKLRQTGQKPKRYALLICPIRSNQRKYAASEYVSVAKKRGFNVNVAGIEKSWDENPVDLSKLKTFCRRDGISYLSLDLSNDQNLEAGRLRKKFYP